MTLGHLSMDLHLPRVSPGTWIFFPTSKLCLRVAQHLLQLWDAEKSDAEMLVLFAWEHL